MSPDPEASADMSARQAVLEAENFIETYQIIGEWIRFADAKAAVTLTVNGVLLGLLIPTLRPYLTDRLTVHPFEWWHYLVLGLFAGWLLLLVWSASQAFLCILPLRRRGAVFEDSAHFHPAAIARKYPLQGNDAFIADCDRIGMSGFKREILTAILVDSHLSNAKYACVTRAIWGLAGSVVMAFLYLVAIQF